MLAFFNHEEDCQTQKMMEKILAEDLFALHRDSNSEYFLYQNEYTEKCNNIRFGNKLLKLSKDTTGRVFIIKDIQYDTLKHFAKMAIFLPSDNMLLNGQFTHAGKGWELENLSFIEY